MNAIPIHARNPGPITGDGNWTWLLRGRVPTLIDAGTGNPEHLRELAAALDGAGLAQVLVTHGHTDHASGAEALAERHGGAVFRKWPSPERDRRWAVPWAPLADGAVVAAGDTELVVVHTPGHAPDHLCFWHEETRTLFGGDLAIQGTTVWIPASLDGDLAAYLASLTRVLALRPARILPAHGPAIDRPDALLRQYLEHRAERERQIVDALRHGAADPDEIVRQVYAGLKPAQLPLARESVLAHLVKLAREGRARNAGEAWHIIEP